MDNYYKILNLDNELQGDALKKELNKIQKKWMGRQNAPDLTRRQEAERILSIIQKAEQILLDDSKRKDYNEQLLSMVVERPLMDSSEEGDIEVLIAQAWDLLSENRYADAIVIAKKATTIDVDHSHAWEILGLAYYMWNDYELAIECYKKAIHIAPNNSQYYYDLCNVYLDTPNMIKEDKLRAAKASNEKALYINPNETSYQLQSALIDRLLEDFDRAIVTLENLLAIENDSPSYRSELTAAYFDKANSFLFLNQYNSLSYIISKEDGEKALIYFEKSLLYADSQDDIAMIKNWIDIANRSFEKKFDNPGFKAFVIPIIVLLIGISSSTISLILISVAFVGWIFYANYVPGWKINQVLMREYHS